MTKQQPTRRQSAARAALRASRNQVRAWRQAVSMKHELAGQKARKKAAKEAAARAKAGKSGVGRVPERLRVAAPEPTWIHKHEPVQRGVRWINGTPYVNPDRDAKSAKSGRLRKELR